MSVCVCVYVCVLVRLTWPLLPTKLMLILVLNLSTGG